MSLTRAPPKRSRAADPASRAFLANLLLISMAHEPADDGRSPAREMGHKISQEKMGFRRLRSKKLFFFWRTLPRDHAPLEPHAAARRYLKRCKKACWARAGRTVCSRRDAADAFRFFSFENRNSIVKSARRRGRSRPAPRAAAPDISKRTRD